MAGQELTLDEVAPGSDAVQRWAAAHAATTWAVPTAQSAADAPAPGLWQEPVPAVLAAVTEIRTWDGGSGHINRVAWARQPEGQHMLASAAADGVARIWDPDTGGELHTLTGHEDNIGRAEWGYAPGGPPLLATGGFDGTARIWDSGTGRCLRTLNARGPRSTTRRSILVGWGTGRDGQPVLATGDQSGITRIWDPGTGQELYTVGDAVPDAESTNGGFYSMAWGTGASGQARLATARRSGGMLKIWDPGTGQLLYTSSDGRAQDTRALAYGRQADGRLVLATADTDTARVWSEEDGTFTSASLPEAGGGASALSWSPLLDGRLLLATSTSEAVRLWDGHSLDRLHTEEFHLAAGPGRLDWTVTPDGRLLLAVAGSGQIRIWDVALDPPVRPPATKAGPSSALGPLVSGQPGHARLVLPPQELTPRFPEAAQIQEETVCLACATTPDGQTLLATADETTNDAQLWDLESGRHLRTLTGHSSDVLDVAWAQAPGGQLLLATASSDRTARIWDPGTGRELRTLDGHDDAVNAVAWGTRPDGTLLLATVGEDRTVRIWDPDTGRTIRTLTGHSRAVYAVAWGTRPDGTLLLATGGDDNTARIWDPDTGQELHVLDRHTESVDAVAWTTLPDGTVLLATGSPDGTARIWDPGTGQELHALGRHGRSGDPGQAADELYCIAWARTSDGRLLLGTAGDVGDARIWDPGTGAELAALPGTRSMWRSAAWTRDREGNLLLLLADPAGSGPVRVWLVETGTGGQAVPLEPVRPGTHRAALASGQLLRLGAGGLWVPLGLLADLVTLTGAEDSALAGVLHDGRLAALGGEPGITRLRDLAAGPPPWRPEARAAFAALIAGDLDIPGLYRPPDEAGPAALAAALAAALGSAGGVPGAAWQPPVAGLRAAVARVTAQAITLLEILGPDACAADPLLPLRLAHHIPRLPALSPRELQLVGSWQPAATPAAALGTLTHSPGIVGVARSGPLTRLLPTQLALPPDLLTTRMAEDQLLYRQHRAPAPPAPTPLTLILDTTPPTYGPAGNLLRLAAHLITTTLWGYGHDPTLITLSTPTAPAPLHTPADLITIWTAATLDDPGPPLATARRTAASTGLPVLLLTHHSTARDNHYTLAHATRLLTTHQPPETPPLPPVSPWHAHLPPDATHAQLATTIGHLLVLNTENNPQ